MSVLRRRADLARARRTASPRSSTRARCRTGCRCSRKTGACSRGAGVHAAAGDAHRDRNPAVAGLHRSGTGVYLRGAVLAALPFGLMAVLRCSLQVIINQQVPRVLSAFILVVCAAAGRCRSCASSTTSACTAAHPTLIYSDMNGYGHYLLRLAWFDAVLERLRGAAAGGCCGVLGARRGDQVAWSLAQCTGALAAARVHVAALA